ncbi:Cytochrome p450 [Thalictrum thalictroides]|uniref:Cytochrome p450 n=1 Tax=Thalictrum thalictroides TaxID=46969 RepID=A0A7J6WWD8_THATH|nr:Cytochrome p450 [Thalictrum thalictroides]
MELNTFSMFYLIALFISLILVKFLVSRNKYKSLNFPPGRKGWPIIGETLDYLSTAYGGSPERFINDRMQEYASPVFKTSLFGETVVVFCGPAGNKFLFSNEGTLVTPWLPYSCKKILLSNPQASHNEDAKILRKHLQNFLKPEALYRYIGKMDFISKQHIKTHWANKKEVIVSPLAKIYTFALVCKSFLSIDDPVQVATLSAHFRVLLSGLVSVPIDLPGTKFNKAIKASNVIRKFLLEKIHERKVAMAENKVSTRQDILSHMLLTSDHDGKFMSEMDIVDKIIPMLVGAHDTTTATITFVIKYLAELPHIYNAVRKEQMEILESKKEGELLNSEDIQKMKYTWDVAREVMRLTPPAQGSFKEAIEDFTYEGFSIRKGWKLFASISSTHRDVKHFPDPEIFDPLRYEGSGPNPYTYIPFGGGPRMCPGIDYARLEILIFVHNLITNFKWEKIFPDEKLCYNPLPMPSKGLPIRLHPQYC